MEEVILSDLVRSKLKNLVQVLTDKDYFGFKDSAIEYVERLTYFIYTIPNQTIRKTRNSKYGAYYARFDVKNKRTAYYITFDVKGDKYIIENIFTSHESGYATYIKGEKSIAS